MKEGTKQKIRDSLKELSPEMRKKVIDRTVEKLKKTYGEPPARNAVSSQYAPVTEKVTPPPLVPPANWSGTWTHQEDFGSQTMLPIEEPLPKGKVIPFDPRRRKR